MSTLADPAPLPFVHDLAPARLRELQARAAQAAGLAPFFRDPLGGGGQGPELAVVPPGAFEMGAPEAQRRFGELPLHRARLDRAYAIGRHAVTADEFRDFEAATGHAWPDHLLRSEGRHPAVNIALADAEAYLAWLSAQTGRRYRLPTEAEWEYAARAGSRTAYCFGDRLTCGEANVGALAAPGRGATGWRRFVPFCVPLNQTVEVESYPANVWGLYEVHGNVWEFTADAWAGPLDPLDRAGAEAQPLWRVTKGGSWFEGLADARSAARKPRRRDELDVNLGLRVVREL